MLTQEDQVMPKVIIPFLIDITKRHKTVRGPIKKNPPNFGHRPNMGGAGKPFIEKRYGHVLRGEGGHRASSKVFFYKQEQVLNSSGVENIYTLTK